MTWITFGVGAYLVGTGFVFVHLAFRYARLLSLVGPGEMPAADESAELLLMKGEVS
jgi:hypothetical protein